MLFKVCAIASRRGTSLITVADRDGVLMAADDLMYAEQEGSAVPVEQGVRKVFIADNLLIGSAGIIKLTKHVEYKLEDWIINLIKEHRGATSKRPSAFAEAIHAKMRNTFKPIEAIVEHGGWSSHAPGERLVNYVVAGYTENFRQPYIFEVGAEVNPQGNGLLYLMRPHRLGELPHRVWFGEDEFFLRAEDGIGPERSLLEEIAPKVFEDTVSTLPNVPESFQELIATEVSLIKVEAKFNPNKVGTTVNVAVIDRATRKSYAAIL